MPLSPLPLLELPIATPRSKRNRRRAARVRHSFRVNVNGDNAPWKGIDLSLGDMLCVAPVPVWPGNTVRATLRVPDAPDIDVQGEVVELVPHGGDVAMRVCFAPLDTDQSADLSLVMLSLEKLS